MKLVDTLAILVLLGLLIPGMLMASPEKDPFIPYVFGSSAQKSTSDGSSKMNSLLRPLDTQSFAEYDIVGVVQSPDKKMVVVQAPDKRDYFLTVGDALGKEGGVIEDISNDGISLKVGDKMIALIVKHKAEMSANEAQ